MTGRCFESFAIFLKIAQEFRLAQISAEVQCIWWYSILCHIRTVLLRKASGSRNTAILFSDITPNSFHFSRLLWQDSSVFSFFYALPSIPYCPYFPPRIPYSLCSSCP